MNARSDQHYALRSDEVLGAAALHAGIFGLIIRMLFGVVLGSVIVLAFFWVLWRMVSTPMDATEFRRATRIEFSRMRKDTEVASKREEKVERDRPPEQPEIPRMAFNTPGSMDSTVARLSPVVDTSSAMSRMSLSAGSDRDTIPLVRVSPDYPQPALVRALEGWVQVRFTITGSGSVKDAVVVKSSARIFEQPAIKAILRWRYNPRVVDGEAVESVGVQTIIRFTMEKEK